MSFTCTACDKHYKSKRSLDIHIRTHTGEKPFKCEVCDKKFAHKSSLKSHVNTAHVLGYVRDFYRRGETNQQISTSKNEAKGNCGKSTDFEGNVEHERPDARDKLGSTALTDSAIPKAREEVFKCLQCEKSYTGKYSLYAHLKRHEEENSLRWCTTCDRSFSSPSQLKDHKKTQCLDSGIPKAEENVFKCLQCEKSFAGKYSLNAHLKRHDEEENSLRWCATCDRSFSSPSQLKDHQKTHTETFECPTCHQRFSQKGLLRNHERAHTGQKPFQANNEMRPYPGSQPYNCKTCAKSFSSPFDMLVHEKGHRFSALYRMVMKQQEMARWTRCQSVTKDFPQQMS